MLKKVARDVMEFKYWTREQLKKEGKITCEECDFSTEDKKCTQVYPIMAQPEDMYWTDGGSIIGCKHGEPKP